MRLIHRLALRLSSAALAVIAVWSVFFYLAIVNEVNDEMDDSLDDYAEMLIESFRRGEGLPLSGSDVNNQYYLKEVTAKYASSVGKVRYQNHEVYIDFVRENEFVRSVFRIFEDKGKYYEVCVSIPSFEKDDLIESIFKLILILLGALVLSFGVISLFCVSSTTRPLHKLLRWLDSYKPGEKNAALDNDTSITEFNQLNKAVSQMTERVESYGQQQKLFISNASHEMQTPLAIGIGRLESILEEEQLSENQAGELVKVLHSLSGLSQLNKSLLMLSRIDNGQYVDDKPVDLHDMLCSQLPDYEEIYGNKRLKTECVTEGSLVVNMDMTLARILVFNLLKNAFVHCPAGGTIRVRSTDASLTVSNTAEGGALPAGKIFQPFFHSAASSQSTGLGLPLALAVARRYGLRLEYRFNQGEHSFCLNRPL